MTVHRPDWNKYVNSMKNASYDTNAANTRLTCAGDLLWSTRINTADVTTALVAQRLTRVTRRHRLTLTTGQEHDDASAARTHNY